MSFSDEILSHARPEHIADVELPRRAPHFPSPADWKDEVLYFLLVDRFSDGREDQRGLLARDNLAAARPASWRWDDWSRSGGERWQGGTLAGVSSKLDYLQELGVSTIWLSPVFKQRGHLDTFHGYGIQDFLDVDARFGTRAELASLVEQAHQRGMRILMDIIFNHSGDNWFYPAHLPGGGDTPHYTSGRHPFGQWRGIHGEGVAEIEGADQGVWPRELQHADRYTRAGSGSLGHGDVSDEHAEHKRTDFITLRDFNLAAPGTLSDLARCYCYWIALTDCDGFRIDTLKHVSLEQARNFCGALKEFAANLGKHNFFLLGEIAGGDYGQDRYLDVLARNLDAALDIGGMRLTLNGVAKGLMHPENYFSGFDAGNAVMGSHRVLGDKHVSILDDHDHVFGQKLRFSSEAASPAQIAAAVGLQLFSLGIPCIYYGSEQSLGGPEPSERKWLPDWGSNDRYLRETMFGAEHPRKSGRAGLPGATDTLDSDLPGFGAFGTVGFHVFDTRSPAFARIQHMIGVRRRFPVLAKGRQYPRPVSFLGYPFAIYGNGELMAFSRILFDEEVLVVINPHGRESRGADVVVDAVLNPEGREMQVIANTAEAAITNFGGTHPTGERVLVRRASNGAHYVALRDIGPSELVLLTNRP